MTAALYLRVPTVSEVDNEGRTRGCTDIRATCRETRCCSVLVCNDAEHVSRRPACRRRSARSSSPLRKKARSAPSGRCARLSPTSWTAAANVQHHCNCATLRNELSGTLDSLLRIRGLDGTEPSLTAPRHDPGIGILSILLTDTYILTRAKSRQSLHTLG